MRSYVTSGISGMVDGTRPASTPFSVPLLTISAFVIVTTEFVIVGLLPGVATDLSISTSTAGLLVTLFAFTVTLFGPPLTALVSHLDRKRLFVAILLVFAASNALAAMASNVWVLGLARFVPALVLPVFWGTASETAGTIVGPQRASRAVSQVYFGIAGAMVFGIPAGTLGATAFGWRGTFWVLAVLSLVMAVLLLIVMPTLDAPKRQRIGEQMSILKRPVFVAQLVLSVLAFTASFTAYTYLADLLGNVAGIPAAHVGWWLMGFGAIGLVGNWIGGLMAERRPLRATLVTVAVLAIGVATFVPMAGSVPTLLPSLAIWGIANTALYPICQVRVMQAATQAQALAGTLNVSMANAGIGLGAAIGGMVIDRLGIESLGYVAAAICVLSALWAVLIRFLSDQR